MKNIENNTNNKVVGKNNCIGKRKHKPKPKPHRDIAMQRITQLFEQAFIRFNEDKNLSNRYVALARKISQKYKVTIPSNLKRQFCKHCYSYLMPGTNCTIRLTGKTITYSCKECRKFMRMMYKLY